MLPKCVGYVFCRLVSKGHIPYVNIHALFPEEMKFFGKDARIFRVEVGKQTLS